ncbi:MAG: hypothetical protein KDC90_15220, partial [Ignavibacteriae bacterium]|nr:hypothetical protein [Ignavibacteriota bacterium]
CNVAGKYHLRGIAPLSVILGTGYHLEIASQEMQFDLYGRQSQVPMGGMRSTQLPIAYDECFNLWPALTILTELSWFSKAVFIRIIQYLQLTSGLTDVARVNIAQDKRFALALQELSHADLIAIDLSIEEQLSNFSIRKLKELARDSDVKLGTIPKKNSKGYICQKIAEKVDAAQLTTILEQHDVNREQIRPLLSNIETFKKYIWAEIHRIDLYINWLVESVRHRTEITTSEYEISSIFRQKKGFIPKLYEEDTSKQDGKPVPYFERYYATPDMMDKSQRVFFDFLVDEIEHGRFPSVHGNISYLFAYIYPFIMKWNEKGYEYVYDKLLNLAEAYHQEEKFAFYCKLWAYECLLALKKYDEYLELTAPEDILPSRTFHSNIRCNVLYHVKYPLHVSDMLSLFGWKSRISLTEYTLAHLSAFADVLNDVFIETERDEGYWLERMLAVQENPTTNSKTLFIGVPISDKPSLDFPLYDFSAEYWYFIDIIADLMRKAENLLREKHDLPKVGEGWISETQLYYSIKEAFPQTEVVHHGRPNWLGRQHLDIWLPRWKIAVEYHGLQHFQPVDFFGGNDVFEATKERDERKQRLCEDNNVTLIIATSDDAHERIIEKISKVRLLQQRT